MNPVSYFCTKCDFKGSSLSAWGSFNYKTEEESVPVNRVIGVCYNCNAITPVEKMPEVVDANPLKENYILDKLVEDEEKRLELLANRESEARCLDCGSHDFDVIPDATPRDKINYSGTPWNTGLIHKICGGEIHARYSSVNLNMGDRLPNRFYRKEGIEITGPE